MEMNSTVLPEATTGEVSGDLAIKASLIAAAADAFTDPTGAEPITLEEAKAHLRVVGSDEDAYVTGLITAAREMAEGRLNRTLAQRTRTEVFASWREVLVLPKPPIVSVESVTYTDDAGEVQTLAQDQYFAAVHQEPAGVELAPGFQPPTLHFRRHPIAVTYTAGYPEGDVPRPIIQWMLLSIGTMYDNRATLINGTTSQALADDFVKWLLQPYMVYE